MKKIPSFLALSYFLLAASNEDIIKFYESTLKLQYPSAKVSVLKRDKVAKTGFESVELGIEIDGQKQKEILFTKDDLVVPDIIDIKEKISYRNEYEMAEFMQSKLEFENKALKALKDEKQIIKIGDSKKPLVYVFTDPECPYCRQHLKNIKEELKNNQIAFIITPVHPKSAFEKAALIYKEAANAKTDAQKIAIFEKYYDENIKNYDKVSDKELKAMYALFDKYKNLGLRSVPTIIEAK